MNSTASWGDFSGARHRGSVDGGGPRWRQRSATLAGPPTFTTCTGRSPAARSTLSTVDPFSRRDQPRWPREPITSCDAETSRADLNQSRSGVCCPDLEEGPVHLLKQSAVFVKPRARGPAEVVDRADVYAL